MALVVINGQVYEEEISRFPVSLEEEERKLAAIQGAIESDEREKREQDVAIAEIDSSNLLESVKNAAKASVIISPSGVRKEDADKQDAKVKEIKRLLASKGKSNK